MGWTDLLSDDVPPDEVLRAAVAAGLKDAPDVRWKLEHFAAPDRDRKLVCFCAYRPTIFDKPGLEHARVPMHEVTMRRHEVRIRDYGPFNAYLGQCPGCRTIYWDLWPA